VEAAVSGSPWGGVELLERAIGYARGVLALVTPEDLTRTTPCTGWDLRRLLGHMNDSLALLEEAGSAHRVRLAIVSDDPADPVPGLRARACQLLATWSAFAGPGQVSVDGRPLTTPVLTSAGALEIAVHGWDVSAACGARRPLPDALAVALLRVAPVLVTDEDRPGRFGVPLPAPAGAAPGDRLLAFLGRDPVASAADRRPG
jgi:uncharacterized protein (TIGR03086 family)